MAKVAIIGAGSIVFCQTLILDILGTPGLQTGDTEKIVQACALDPLTAAVLTLKEIRDMAVDMLEAEREWLPQFAGKTIRATPTIVIPKDVKPAQVPIDPALAIYARFGVLGK